MDYLPDGLDALFDDDQDVEVLDEDYWSLEGGGGSPGNSDDGTYYLLRVDGEYRVCHSSGGETSDEGSITANSDALAVKTFRAKYTGSPDTGD